MRLGKNLCELIRIMFMKKLVINAASIGEAKEMAAEQGLTVVHDSTPSWKKAGTPAVGSQEFYDFATDALKANKLVDAKGVGIIVSIDPGVADTRERPYKFNNVVSEGRKSYITTFEVRRKDNGALVGRARKKKEAEKLAKKAMVDVKADMTCEVIKTEKTGNSLAFTLDYVPSINAKTGTYVVFGNESF